MTESPKRLTGDEAIHEGGLIFEDEIGRATVRDWWSWSFSNALDDGVRGALAEYLVARLLGASEQPAKGWPYDFALLDGTRIEVKSSAHHQAWEKPKLTSISFNVPRSREMKPGKGFEPEARTHADIFVFCALTEKDRSLVDPFDLSQWRFFAATASVVDDLAGKGRTISLGKLEKRVGHTGASDLRRRVDELRGIGTSPAVPEKL